MCDIVGIQLGTQCGANMGGTKLKLHFTKIGDIKTFAVPTNPPATPLEKYTIKTAHTNKTGKKFESIEILRNSGTNNYTGGGNHSGKKTAALKFRVPSNNDQATFVFNTFANGVVPLIFLVENANEADGAYDQIGTEKFPAYLEAELINGDNEGDGSVYEFTVTCNADARYKYTAAVPLTAGV